MTVEVARPPLYVRAFAHFVSVVFHPLFLPVYITLFLVFVHPFLFAGFAEQTKWRLVATVFINLALFPAVTVLLCWRLKFVDSLQMRTQKERLIPLAAAMIFYFWGWYVLRGLNTMPEPFKNFMLGSFITIIAAWLANIYFKISLHALGAGGLVTFMALLVLNVDGGSASYLALAVAVAGLICSARLLLLSHRPGEVYAGLLLGALSQVIAVVV